MDVPGGRSEDPGRERVVKVTGEARTVDEVRDLVVATPGGAPVRVRDVADVVDGPAEPRSAAAHDGRPAVALVVKKQSGANTVAVADRVTAALPGLQALLPQGAELSLVRDNSRFIRRSIAGVQEDLVLGGLLAVAIVLVFLRNWRSTLVSALALPTSVIGTFAVMHALGYTFNVITMLALTLSIGLLIDDAIVVIENISRHAELGQPPARAAHAGTKEIALAVLAVTLSILAVFVPVAFMEGIVGRFFAAFGVTVAVAVAISYLVSMTLTPMASAIVLRGHGHPGRVSRAIERALTATERAYRAVLAWALDHRLATLGIALAALVATVGLGRFLQFTFIPAQDMSEVKVTLELPPGTPLARTERELEALRQQLSPAPRGCERLRHRRRRRAGGGAQGRAGGVAGAHQGPRLRPAGAQGVAARQPPPPGRRAARRAGPGPHRRQRQPARPHPVQRARARLGGGGGRGREGARPHGGEAGPLLRRGHHLPPGQAAGVGEARPRPRRRPGHPGGAGGPLGAGLPGRRRLRPLPPGQRSLRRPAAGYRPASAAPTAWASSPCAAPAASWWSCATSPPCARRRRSPRSTARGGCARSRSSPTSPPAPPWARPWGSSTPSPRKELPKSVVTDFEGQGKELGKTGAAFLQALLLGIVLVYMILAAQFGSLVDPFTIMLALPFAITGALAALLASGQFMSLFAMIGMIMLMGLVTKNGILVVEFTNQLEAQGRSTREALLEAGPIRLRPILMTTIAMIAGMVPVALARGDGAEMRVPMAIAIIGGLVSSTVLTLVVVPVFYAILDRLKHHRTWAGLDGEQGAGGRALSAGERRTSGVEPVGGARGLAGPPAA